MAESNKIISLITDFGNESYYPGVMKAVIKNINPQVSIVDISHSITPYDIGEASFVLMQSYSYFPVWSIHVVVVDPGVGSPRRPLLVFANNHFFIAPDNGILTKLIKSVEVPTIRELTAEHYFLPQISSTFHGRDIFAPVAAWLSTGKDASYFGDIINDPILLEKSTNPVVKDGCLQGEIIHIDQFGNLITNIDQAIWQKFFAKSKSAKAGGASAFSLQVNNCCIEKISKSYFEVEIGEPVALFSSAGLLELALREDNAYHKLGCQRGQKVSIYLKKS